MVHKAEAEKKQEEDRLIRETTPLVQNLPMVPTKPRIVEILKIIKEINTIVSGNATEPFYYSMEQEEVILSDKHHVRFRELPETEIHLVQQMHVLSLIKYTVTEMNKKYDK